MLTSDAGIAQLVEHNLAMVRVASSNLVSRSNLERQHKQVTVFFRLSISARKTPSFTAVI